MLDLHFLVCIASFVRHWIAPNKLVKEHFPITSNFLIGKKLVLLSESAKFIISKATYIHFYSGRQQFKIYVPGCAFTHAYSNLNKLDKKKRIPYPFFSNILKISLLSYPVSYVWIKIMISSQWKFVGCYSVILNSHVYQYNSDCVLFFWTVCT